VASCTIPEVDWQLRRVDHPRPDVDAGRSLRTRRIVFPAKEVTSEV
jgi:hypothetical protein